MAGLHLLHFTPDPARFDQGGFEAIMLAQGAVLTVKGDPRHTLDPHGGEQPRAVDSRLAAGLLAADLSTCGLSLRDGGPD